MPQFNPVVTVYLFSASPKSKYLDAALSVKRQGIFCNWKRDQHKKYWSCFLTVTPGGKIVWIFHTRVSTWRFLSFRGCYLYPTPGKCFQKPAMRIVMLSTAHGISVQVAPNGYDFHRKWRKACGVFPNFPAI